MADGRWRMADVGSDTARPRFGAALALALTLATAPAFADNFESDLQALTRHPHRLAASPELHDAASHVAARLEAIGVDDVLPLEFLYVTPRVARCTLEVGGKTVELAPMRPNVLQHPVTGPDGLTGPLIYAGQGDPLEYGNRSAAGAIVVLDYDGFDQWETAFSLGAKAVVFLERADARGEPTATPPAPRHADVPANLVRGYALADADGVVDGLDLTADHERATLTSHVTWARDTADGGRVVGRNIAALIRGTDPTVGGTTEGGDAEMLVLSAALDTWGNVPTYSPGTRGAANVAALLATAEHLVANRPRRHVLLLFLDGEAHSHQGGREVYDALKMSAKDHASIRDTHRAELEATDAMTAALDRHGLSLDQIGDGRVRNWLIRELGRQAEWVRDERVKQQQLIRLGAREAEDEQQALAVFEAERLAVDEYRRALHNRELGGFIASLERRAAGGGDDAAEARGLLAAGDAIRRSLAERLARRRVELEHLIAIDAQREALRAAVSEGGGGGAVFSIPLHIGYELGDATAKWGPVAGDKTEAMFETFAFPKSSADSPGYYSKMLRVIREGLDAAGMLPPEDEAGGIATAPGRLSRLDRATLGVPTYANEFVPRFRTHTAAVAGLYGHYNLAAMTGFDARPRDGHPADTVANLAWDAPGRLRDQARELTAVVAAIADLPEASQPRQISAVAETKRPGWSGGVPSGDVAKLSVTGGLAEQRAAEAAVVAVWPARKNMLKKAWTSLDRASQSPAYSPIVLEPANVHGRFRLLSLRGDQYAELAAYAVLFDGLGRAEAMSSTDTLLHRRTDSIATSLFLGSGYAVAHTGVIPSRPELLQLLRGRSDAAPRQNRALTAQLGAHTFFFLPPELSAEPVKLFQPYGPVLLGQASEDQSAGSGIDPARLATPPHITPVSASDLWGLNEMRLDRLRSRSIKRSDLEALHAAARGAMPAAMQTEVGGDRPGDGGGLLAAREAKAQASAALSWRTWGPIRGAMDDLVTAVVVLLLLTIPFAFAMERLLIGAASIYGRIGGFVLIFLITFGLLYLMHPGFAIASTPVIIFLAFAIILLSSMVIFILSRKFSTELKALQGQATGHQQIEVSRAGTLLAAVGMGMSTMRRRPTRTTLSAVTVVVLTFTILCFASFEQTVGVRAVYEGQPDADAPRAALLRKLDYSAVEPGVLQMLHGLAAGPPAATQPGKGVAGGRSTDAIQAMAGAAVSPQYWAIGDATNEGRFAVTTPAAGEAAMLTGVMGLDPAELGRWPQLATALVADSPDRGPTDPAAVRAALDRGEVFLPSLVQSALGVRPGDPLLLHGRPAVFAGAVDGTRLARLRHLDGEPITPVDFTRSADSSSAGSAAAAADTDDTALEDVQLDFVKLSADAIAVTANRTARQAGGELHVVTVYPPAGAAADAALHDIGRGLAELVVMPVWVAGEEGVERLLFTRLTGVQGGLALGVPLVLGGLIIFGTLLGSISDREREIYTFSALGLAPAHVGLLFFAEAAVYAIVGGMGGQLLAQTVGLGLGALGDAGLVTPIEINYSSTNSLFAMAIVMATVLISAIYPAMRASKSANPGLARTWKLPAPDGDTLEMTFPFTVSAYDITGIVSFLGEHFRRHDDAGLGTFAASDVRVGRSPETGQLELRSDLALAPFDLGVTEHLRLTAVPSEIEGIDEVAIAAERTGGARGDWHRANRVFLRDLRQQFLIWRTLSAEAIERYRKQTFAHLGEQGNGHGQTDDATRERQMLLD